MTNSDAEARSQYTPGAKISNSVTGPVSGSSLQAGAIHGGVHIHHNPQSALGVVPRQLRPVPAHFTGRAEELAELDRIAVGVPERAGPIVAVICGPGGVGKTALALCWLHGAVDRYPDGQLYVDLGPVGPAGPMLMTSVLGGFLRALGISGQHVPVDAGEAAALFRSVTADRRIAVFVDNAASTAQVRTLLPASPSSVLVVASRWRLGGLVTDGAEFLTLGPLGDKASTELLTRAIGDPRVSREPAAVAQLIRLCGGLPIALGIAAARLAMRPRWQVARVVQDLVDEQRRLSALSLEQDISVHGVFDLSYEGLPAVLARAYRWLGLYPGTDFPAGVAAAVLMISETAVTEMLETLVDTSLLDAAEADRYRFHDLIRLHARQCAAREDTASDRSAVIRRVAEYHLARCVAADRVVMPLEWHLGPEYQRQEGEPPAHPSGVAALDSLERELPNIMATLRAAGEHGCDDLVWQLCEALWSLFLYRKHFADWMAAHRLGIAAAERCGALAAKSRMYRRLGLAFHNLRQSDEAVEQGRVALDAARAANHVHAESEALNLIGMANRARGHHEEALDVLRKTVDLDRRAGLRRNEALDRRRLGQALTDAGRFQEAITELRLGRQLAAAIGDGHVESNTMVWLADALNRVGRSAEAVELLREAWATLRASGAKQYQAHVLMVWGEADERLGDLVSARDHLSQARDLYGELGAPHVARVLDALAEVEDRLSTDG